MENCDSSFRSIVLNIHYFIEYILKAAFSDSRWNEEALHNSIGWAGFCEKITTTLCKKQPKALVNLNLCVVDLVKEVPNGLIRECNIGMFYQSTQILLMLLLQNHQLPSEIFLKVMDMYEHDERHCEQAFRHVLNMNCKELGSIVQQIETKSSIIKTNKWISLAGILFINRMHKQRTHFLHDDFLSKCTTNRRLGILLSAISLPEVLLPLHTKDCQDDLATWLCQTLQEERADVSIWEELWKQPETLIVATAVRQPRFFETYLGKLLGAGHAMKQYYSGSRYTWLKSREIDVPLEFTQLVRHLQLLLNARGNVKKLTKQELVKFASERGCSIWEDILVECSQI